MLNQIARMIIWMFRNVLVRLPHKQAVNLVVDMIQDYTETKTSREGVCFLLEIDNRLYHLQGAASVADGGGVHSKHRHMHYHDFFTSRVSPDERVLDIGCGIGAVSFDIAEKVGCQVVGVDLEEVKIEVAEQKYPHGNITYIVGDVLTDVPAGSFDVLILSNVLEHLPDRSEFLKRVAAQTGSKRLLIRVPLFERDWRVPLKKELGLEWRLDKTHETEYTLESFQEEIEQAGLYIYSQEVRWGEIWAEVRVNGS
jgi:SAM-dependent methyltransferase